MSRLSSLEEHKPKQVSHLTHQFSPFKSDVTYIEPPETHTIPLVTSSLDPSKAGELLHFKPHQTTTLIIHHLNRGPTTKLMVGQCGRAPQLSTPNPKRIVLLPTKWELAQAEPMEATKEKPPKTDQKGSNGSRPGSQDVTSRIHPVLDLVCHPVPSHVLNRLSRFPPGSCPFPARSGN